MKRSPYSLIEKKAEELAEKEGAIRDALNEFEVWFYSKKQKDVKRLLAQLARYQKTVMNCFDYLERKFPEFSRRIAKGKEKYRKKWAAIQRDLERFAKVFPTRQKEQRDLTAIRDTVRNYGSEVYWFIASLGKGD